jgi:hypothetical protein
MKKFGAFLFRFIVILLAALAGSAVVAMFMQN